MDFFFFLCLRHLLGIPEVFESTQMRYVIYPACSQFALGSPSGWGTLGDSDLSVAPFVSPTKSPSACLSPRVMSAYNRLMKSRPTYNSLINHTAANQRQKHCSWVTGTQNENLCDQDLTLTQDWFLAFVTKSHWFDNNVKPMFLLQVTGSIPRTFCVEFECFSWFSPNVLQLPPTLPRKAC